MLQMYFNYALTLLNCIHLSYELWLNWLMFKLHYICLKNIQVLGPTVHVYLYVQV